jgi:hypothetical protein
VRTKVIIFGSNKPFWKYCSNCGEIIDDDDIDKFLKKVEEHNCKKEASKKVPRGTDGRGNLG